MKTEVGGGSQSTVNSKKVCFISITTFYFVKECKCQHLFFYIAVCISPQLLSAHDNN